MPKISKDLAVRILTIVLTPVVGGATAYAAKRGVNLPSGDIVTLTALSGAGVLGLGFHWLQRQPAVLKGEQDLETLAGKVASQVAADPQASAAAQDLKAALDSQRTEILAAIEKLAPASTQNVLGQIAQALQNAPAVAPAVPVDPAPPSAPAV